MFSATDWMQHIIWRHIDETHPMYDPQTSPKYNEEFVKFWQRIDKILGNILGIIPKDTIVFLVSDHGFGPNDQTFNLAKWLIMKGYLLVRKRDIKKLIKKFVYKTAIIVAKTPIKKLIPAKTRKNVGNVLRTNIADEVNFEKSKAYCLGHTIPFGAIYINAQNEREREEIKEKLMHDLMNLSNDIGKKVNVQIFEPKKLYSGEKVHLLPDIIFTINDWRCVIIEDNFDRPLFEEKPFSTRHTGT
ncbi:alkaline phosphatase family protein [Pyrococcus yayanosii]|uniref:alkaline phosphatase family protein n=1 Tax=Pyrococcus yayanosii TaxID=1008460 RepID=UPI0013050808|nr:alkaline phosphatase family protein [Pyrococcus yayanosii]